MLSSVQNQAKAALLLLYQKVLEIQLPWLDEVISAKPSKRLRVMLTPTEVRRLLDGALGTMNLIANLLYETGMASSGRVTPVSEECRGGFNFMSSSTGRSGRHAALACNCRWRTRSWCGGNDGPSGAGQR